MNDPARDEWSLRRAAFTAAIVVVAYYAAARLGLALRPLDWALPAQWLPNAVLLTALLVLPVRAWWVPLAAMAPAHAAAQIGAGLGAWQLGTQIAGSALLACLMAGLILVLLRHRSAATVAAHEAQFRALFDSNVVPVLYWHMDGRVVEANDAYLELCGRTRVELEAGRVRWDRIGADDASSVELGRRDVARLRAGIRGGAPFEHMYRLPDGRRLPVLIAGSLLPGSRNRGLAFAIDLTEQKRADEEQARLNTMLERERRRLDDVIANVPGVVWETWTEPRGFIRRSGFVSEHVRKMTGYTPAEWLSRPSSWLSLVHEEDRERAEREALQFMTGGSKGVHEMRWLTRDGRELWVESHVAPIRDEAGRSVGLRGITLDISERKRAELAREQVDARNRAIIKAVPDLMFVLDADGVYLDYFARDEADLLVPPNQFLGRNQAEILPPEVDQVLRRAFADVRRTRGVRVIEYMLPLRGEDRWWEARVVPCGAEQILAMIRDITERKQAEQRLIETQKRYALATTAGRVAVWSYDVATGRIESDPMLHEILGLDRGEVDTQQAVLERLHADDLERVVKYERLLLDSVDGWRGNGEVSLPEMEHRVFDSEGKVRWFLTRGAVLRGGPGAAPRVLGTATEITALKKAEQWLRDGEVRFRTLAETVPDIIFTSLPDGSRDYVNPQFYAYTGLPAGSGLGFGWTRALHPDDREGAEQQWLWASSNGSAYENEYRLCAPDRSYRWYFGRCLPVRSDDGQIVKWVGCATDITARKVAEQALRESTEALRQSKEQIHGLVGRLLLEREEEQKRISLNLHDEVNQQVAALAMSLSTLKRHVPNAGDPVHQAIVSIQKRAEELSTHIRNLSHQLHSATLHHIGLVPALRALASQLSQNDGIRVDVEVDGTIAQLPAHVELCLYRVAEEALRNVARHAGVRAARLSVVARTGHLDVRIGDDGRGFDLVKGRHTGGIGLLSIEERLRVIGGRLEILTRPGAGVTVIGRVPLPAPDPALKLVSSGAS